MRAARSRSAAVLIATAALGALPAAASAAALPAPVWETPQPVGTGDGGGTVKVAATAQGRLVAIWGSGTTLNTAIRNPGEDEFGEARAVLSADSLDGLRSVATPDGDLILVVDSTTNNTGTSRLLSLDAGSDQWDLETIGTGLSWGASAAVDRDGGLVLSWIEWDGSSNRVAVARRAPGEASFGPQTYASPPGDNAQDTLSATGPGGEQLVVWVDDSGGPGQRLVRLRSRSGPDADWENSAAGTPSGASDGFYLAEAGISDGGTAVVLYAQQSGSNISVWRAVRLSGGSFAADMLHGPGAIPGMVLTSRGDFVVTTMAGPGMDLVGAGQVLRAGATVWSGPVAPSPGGFSGLLSPVSRPDGSVYANLAYGASIFDTHPAIAAWNPDRDEWSIPRDFTSEPLDPIGGLSLAGDSEGNLAATWRRTDGTVVVSLGDGAGPALSDFSVPSAAQAGERVALSVAADDRWSQVRSVRWSFGDGAAATGDDVRHSYAAGGAYTVTVTATDGVGNTSSKTATVTVSDPPAPPADEPDDAGGKPPVVTPPLIEARLAGRTVTLNAKLTLKKGKRCSGTVKATTAFGGRRYKTTLRLKTAGGVCRATGAIKLKKTPSLRTKLRITVTGAQANSRTLTTRRG